MRNWAANIGYSAERILRPTSVQEVQDIVAKSPRVKALGTRHSFNDIADSTGDLVSTEMLDHIIGVDDARNTVTVEGGATYGAVASFLDGEGLALSNLASLPHISVAGACATATHGSGVKNGNLSTSVAAMDVVIASGEIVRFSRHSQDTRKDLSAMAVHLGALGIVVRITLDVTPAFLVRQDVYENLEVEEMEPHFDQLLSCGYSVSLFTDWRRPVINQIWIKRATADRARPGPTLLGAQLATRKVHPIDGVSAENCTEQLGEPGPWHERLPHFRMDYMPSSGEELQSEYLVPRARGLAAFRALASMSSEIAPLVHVSEIRTVAADDLWMSPCYRQDCVAFHFTWKKDWPSVQALLPRIESALSRFEARPHWGKLFATSGSVLRKLYPRLEEFKGLMRSHDPDGKFRNAFLDKL